MALILFFFFFLLDDDTACVQLSLVQHDGVVMGNNIVDRCSDGPAGLWHMEQ